MTDQALIYVFAISGVLALYAVAVWVDSWRRTKSLDAAIAAFRAERRTEAGKGREAAESAFRVAILDPADAAGIGRVLPSRARFRRARAESMRMVPLRPRPLPSEFKPGE